MQRLERHAAAVAAPFTVVCTESVSPWPAEKVLGGWQRKGAGSHGAS